MIELIHKYLCKFGLHSWHPFYDTEYSRNGEAEFCVHCEVER